MWIVTRGNSVSASFHATSETTLLAGVSSIVTCRAGGDESLDELNITEGTSVQWYLVRGTETVLIEQAKKTNYALHSKLEEAYRNGVALYESNKETNLCAGLIYHAPKGMEPAQLQLAIGARDSTFAKLERVFMDTLRGGEIEYEFQTTVLLSTLPNRWCASPEEVVQGWPMFTKDVEIRFRHTPKQSA